MRRKCGVAVVPSKSAQATPSGESMDAPAPQRAKMSGFCSRIDEPMAVNDIILSTAGGLTTSEVLARGAAMAIVNPIPGQESRNSDFLLENGAAIKINNAATMPQKLTELLYDPARLARLKANGQRLGHQRSAYDVAKIA